ncbi:MAG: hypothetical protein QOG62_975 [Thermoleophilaceae bacterium]|jgi:hypothetical protein|nr:hypothetical protein [Thermoleophilaceae bacterium]
MRFLAPASLTVLALALPAPASAMQQPPMTLPGDAGVRAKAVVAGSWIVGGSPGAKTDAIAKGFGAERLIPGAGVYAVPTARARSLAAGLKAAGRLVYAEPDSVATPTAFPSDPLTPQQDWLPRIGVTNLTPPAMTATSPLLGIVEESVDVSHTDLADGGHIKGYSKGAVIDEHGTEVAGVAAAPANGKGIVGVWPGARATVFGADPSCESTTAAIAKAVKGRVSVINMSYEFAADACYTHLVATEAAFGAGVVLVGAAGNERATGNNVPSRPGVDPHVVTVGATIDSSAPAVFSTEGPFVDIAAPGVGVLTTTSTVPNGFAAPSGTSFSTPMVAGAALWLRAARPDLTADQASDVLRDSAVDIFSPGWDARTGFGLLNVERALAQPQRLADPMEPNDDILWVDGSVLSPASPAVVSKRGRSRTPIYARLDQEKDQVDVYRALVRPKSHLVVRVKPLSGDPDLEAWSKKAKTVLAGNRGLLGFSRNSGAKPDRITLRNKTKKPRAIYLVAYVDATKAQRSSNYVLNVR